MKLNQIRDNAGAKKNPIRVGRGIGSGKGKTSGKGHKGQKARTGVAIAGFEGGQMPLYQRLPKRGFNNISAQSFATINLGRLQKAIDEKKIDAKKPIDAAALIECGLVRRALDGVRLLGQGELTTKIEIHVFGASKSAAEAVEKAGGKIVILKPEAPTEKVRKLPKKNKAAQPTRREKRQAANAGKTAKVAAKKTTAKKAK